MLSDTEILQRLKFGSLKIEPFDKDRLGSVSYDISTKLVEWVPTTSVWKLVSVERFTLPRDLVGIVSMRSRGSKLGIFTSYSLLVDPGYSGHLIFLIYNPILKSQFSLMPDELKNLFQIMFFKTGKVDVAYNERKNSTAMGRRGF